LPIYGTTVFANYVAFKNLLNKCVVLNFLGVFFLCGFLRKLVSSAGSTNHIINSAHKAGRKTEKREENYLHHNSYFPSNPSNVGAEVVAFLRRKGALMLVVIFCVL
jgi:hypothetical protein